MSVPNNSEFLGRGWKFPPSFSLVHHSVDLVDGEEDIHQSLQILLSTRLGERVLRPDFGCSLKKLIFEPLDATMVTYIRDIVQNAILFHEPRIVVESVHLQLVDQEKGLIHLSIDYEIATTNSRSNFVYPFYLNEMGVNYG